MLTYRALKKILTVAQNIGSGKIPPPDQGIPVTTMREIKVLKGLSDPNIIELLEVAYEQGRLIIHLWHFTTRLSP